jgi:hypothetical protein
VKGCGLSITLLKGRESLKVFMQGKDHNSALLKKGRESLKGRI